MVAENYFTQTTTMLRLLQYLNLDVVLGATLCLLMVQRVSHVPPDLGISVTLALAVFVVYGTDRLLDVFGKKESNILTARHRFYFKYFGGLALLNAQAIWVGGVLAWRVLPEAVFYFGIYLAIASVLYLLLVQMLPYKIALFFPKELIIATMFSVGIWGVVKAQGAETSTQWYLLACIFGLVALLNLLLFTSYEYEKDMKQKQVSLLHKIGVARIEQLFYGLLWLILALSIFVVVLRQNTELLHWAVLATEWLMAAWLTFVFKYRTWFKQLSRYRFAADVVFWFAAWAVLL